MAESFALLAPDVYTTVPVPGYEKDPAVTKAVREFDPGAIPIWRVQLWSFPGSDTSRTIVHHGIGRYYPVPRYLKKPFRVEMPANDRSDPPNVLDAILEDQRTEDYRRGGPGGYLPWDWSLYRWCRWMFDRITADSYRRFLDAKREKDAREYAAMLDEIEGRRRELEPYLLRKAESVSEYGWKQYQKFMEEADRRKRAGLKPLPFRESKPFILVRSPRGEKTFGRVAPAQELEDAGVH
jgi:hypothetical protein